MSPLQAEDDSFCSVEARSERIQLAMQALLSRPARKLVRLRYLLERDCSVYRCNDGNADLARRRGGHCYVYALFPRALVGHIPLGSGKLVLRWIPGALHTRIR